MCGGVIFPYRREYKEMLQEFYSPEMVAEVERSGQVRSVYWQRGAEPILPALVGEDEEVPQLFLWGNRDKELKLPQTGWARVESIEEGKWSYLRPVPVLIPVTHGVEKGKWFDIHHGIRGLLVERGGHSRVYMLTGEADPDFLSVTKHERMPVLVEQENFPWLPGEPGGTLSAGPSGDGGDRR
jgi:hypothetical protein